MEEQRQQINKFKDFNDGVSLFQKICIDTNGIPKEMIIREVKRPRNYEFHKKVFGLVDFAYKNTELPQAEYKGELITQSKQRFREDLTIRSGFYAPEVTKDGTIRAKADSLAYDKCSQTKAEKIFNAMLDVVAGMLADSGYDRETLERLSLQWINFT